VLHWRLIKPGAANIDNLPQVESIPWIRVECCGHANGFHMNRVVDGRCQEEFVSITTVAGYGLRPMRHEKKWRPRIIHAYPENLKSGKDAFNGLLGPRERIYAGVGKAIPKMIDKRTVNRLCVLYQGS
jgi:hypothetical protein